jgi:hypothetical protein
METRLRVCADVRASRRELKKFKAMSQKLVNDLAIFHVGVVSVEIGILPSGFDLRDLLRPIHKAPRPKGLVMAWHKARETISFMPPNLPQSD